MDPTSQLEPKNFFSAKLAQSTDVLHCWRQCTSSLPSIGRRQVAVPAGPIQHRPPLRAWEVRRPAPPQEIPVEIWSALDEFNLSDLFLQRVPMLKKCLHFLRGRLRHTFGVALRETARVKREGDEVSEGRARKLFGLIPMMLLHRPRGTSSDRSRRVGQPSRPLLSRHLLLLVSSAQECVLHARKPDREHNAQSEQERRGRAAQSRVQQGQASRARHELTGAPIAPKNDKTYRASQDRRPREQVRAIPGEVLEFNPSQPLQLEMWTFVHCLRSAPAGSAPDPGGCSYEVLKVCLDDPEVTHLLFMAAEDMARGTASEASRSFLLATTTAISKRDGGVRGNATGTAFRRLVSKTLARQFGAEVEKACAPFSVRSLDPSDGRTAWDMPFGPSPMQTHVPPFCQLTELVLTITCCEVRC